MIIREATLKDVDGIANVHVESWKTTYTGIMPDEAIQARPLEGRKRQWERNLGRENREIFALVAEENGKIIGFADGGKPQSQDSNFDCELFAIYLLKEVQGKGVGRQLMQALVEKLHKAGYKTMVLSVLKENKGSSGFYEAMGGKIVSEGNYRINEEIMLTTVHYGWNDIEILLLES